MKPGQKGANRARGNLARLDRRRCESFLKKLHGLRQILAVGFYGICRSVLFQLKMPEIVGKSLLHDRISHVGWTSYSSDVFSRFADSLACLRARSASK